MGNYALYTGRAAEGGQEERSTDKNNWAKEREKWL